MGIDKRVPAFILFLIASICNHNTSIKFEMIGDYGELIMKEPVDSDELTSYDENLPTPERCKH